MLEPVIKIEYDKLKYNQQVRSKYMLYFRTNANWKKCFKTGLVRHAKTWIFQGNISQKVPTINNPIGAKCKENPKHFVLMQFSEDTITIVVDVFRNFYPFKLDLRNDMVSEHPYYNKKRSS